MINHAYTRLLRFFLSQSINGRFLNDLRWLSGRRMRIRSGAGARSAPPARVARLSCLYVY